MRPPPRHSARPIRLRRRRLHLLPPRPQFAPSSPCREFSPLIRHFRGANKPSLEKLDDYESGSWAVCSPKTAANFTAVGCFFALKLAKELDLPIGLLNATEGSSGSGWREIWKQGDFPFYYVQLAGFVYGKWDPTNPESPSGYAGIREAQLQSLSIKNSGMAVAIDIGEETNIHPSNKQDVGDRLARWALAKDYGRKIPFSGPLTAPSSFPSPDETAAWAGAGGVSMCVGIRSRFLHWSQP